ncbi:hypothetical protein JKP88DRAFT_307287 [Tribonema minus]|uniref:Uncharacterized protein n=1 Tax=Tribonema minus TaxID=303371 RepID=A0A835Z7Q7_9STRA|nr:hypothetical protein JKP88DRAFT_307287 [Tribonema minus]
MLRAQGLIAADIKRSNAITYLALLYVAPLSRSRRRRRRRRRSRELEDELLERDAAAIAARFDLEAAASEAERLQRRHREMQEALRAANARAGADPASPPRFPPHACGVAAADDATRLGGGRFNRERDLETVVEALKRVVEKLRAENDRLKRGAAAATAQGKAGGSDAERRLRRQNEELAQEVAALKARAAAADQSSQQIAQRQDLIGQLRRQLRARDESLSAARRELEAASAARTALAEELDRAKLSQSGGGGGEAEEIEELRAEAQRLRRRLQERGAAAATSGSGGGGGAADAKRVRQLEEHVAVLQEENLRLRSELEPFTLEFFEEIEDLKFKYQEAVRRLHSYERA